MYIIINFYDSLVNLVYLKATVDVIYIIACVKTACFAHSARIARVLNITFK